MDRATDRAGGLDALRLIAAGLVFYQHAFYFLGRDWVVAGGWWVGHLGTAVFFAMSGYLAAGSSRSPGRWLRDRAVKLFPAYWVVVAAGFAAAAALGTHSFGPGQVAGQLAGVGLYTHTGRLVNGVTWFVNLLIPLYLFSFLVRVGGPGVLAAGAIVAVAAAVGGPYGAALYACYAAAFVAGYAVRAARRRAVAAGLAAAGFAGLAAVQPEFRYCAAALALTAAALVWRVDLPGGKAFAGIAYEWFLVHQLCLHAAVWLTGGVVWAFVPLGAGLAFASAAVLRAAVAWAAEPGVRPAAPVVVAVARVPDEVPEGELARAA